MSLTARQRPSASADELLFRSCAYPADLAHYLGRDVDVRAGVPKGSAHCGGSSRDYVLWPCVVAHGDHEPESVRGRDDLELTEAFDTRERRPQSTSVDPHIRAHDGPQPKVFLPTAADGPHARERPVDLHESAIVTTSETS